VSLFSVRHFFQCVTFFSVSLFSVSVRAHPFLVDKYCSSLLQACSPAAAGSRLQAVACGLRLQAAGCGCRLQLQAAAAGPIKSQFGGFAGNKTTAGGKLCTVSPRLPLCNDRCECILDPLYPGCIGGVSDSPTPNAAANYGFTLEYTQVGCL
jgi:hypothetical protein